MSSGCFRIYSEMNGYVLDIRGGSCSQGQQVVNYPAKRNDYDNQLWWMDYATQTIRSELDSDYCLDLNGSNTLVVYRYDGTDSQKWKIDGEHIVQATNPRMAIDVRGNSKKKCAEVIVYPRHNNSNQRWEIPQSVQSGYSGYLTSVQKKKQQEIDDSLKKQQQMEMQRKEMEKKKQQEIDDSLKKQQQMEMQQKEIEEKHRQDIKDWHQRSLEHEQQVDMWWKEMEKKHGQDIDDWRQRSVKQEQQVDMQQKQIDKMLETQQQLINRPPSVYNYVAGNYVQNNIYTSPAELRSLLGRSTGAVPRITSSNTTRSPRLS